MKDYLAFYGEIHYPSGGMEDYIGSYDTLEESISAIESEYNKNHYSKSWSNSWAHVYKQSESSIVYKK